MTSTTVELPDETFAQANALARTTGRTLGEVLSQAIAQGLAYDRWFREQVADALRSSDAGTFASSEDVEALWERLAASSPPETDKTRESA